MTTHVLFVITLFFSQAFASDPQAIVCFKDKQRTVIHTPELLEYAETQNLIQLGSEENNLEDKIEEILNRAADLSNELSKSLRFKIEHLKYQMDQATPSQINLSALHPYKECYQTAFTPFLYQNSSTTTQAGVLTHLALKSLAENYSDNQEQIDQDIRILNNAIATDFVDVHQKSIQSSLETVSPKEIFNSQKHLIPSQDIQILSKMKVEILKWAPLKDGALAENDEGTQGDMIESSAMLCLFGMKERCLDVKRSQDSEGRMWRAPQYIGERKKDTFSRDHFKGVVNYILATKDKEFALKFYQYVSTHQWKMCPQMTWNTCKLLRGGRAQLGRVFETIGLPVPRDLSKHYWIENLSNGWSSVFAKSGFASMLNAYDVITYRAMNRVNPTLKGVVKRTLRRNPNNALALYAYSGASPQMVSIIKEACPNVKVNTPIYKDMIWNRVIQRDSQSGKLYLVRDWGNESGLPFTQDNANGWDCLIAIEAIFKELAI